MKKLLLMAAAAVMSLLAACGGGGGDSVSYTPPPIVAAAEPGWSENPNLPGYDGNYIAAVMMAPGMLSIFSNTKGSVNLRASTMWETSGSFTSLKPAVTSADFGNRFLRTLSVVYSSKTKKCYAVVVLTDEGKGYGEGSYYPWSAETDPIPVFDGTCKGWNLKTKIAFINSSANAALVLNQDLIGAPVDKTNPRNNAFTFVTDGAGARLALMYSNDNIVWHTYEDVNRKVIDLLPSSVLPSGLSGINAQFCTEVKTLHGWHIVCADWSNSANSAVRHVHFFSCDGLKYRVMEENAATFSGPKGIALMYDQYTGDVHSFSGGGRHISFKAQKFACAQ